MKCISNMGMAPVRQAVRRRRRRVWRCTLRAITMAMAMVYRKLRFHSEPNNRCENNRIKILKVHTRALTHILTSTAIKIQSKQRQIDESAYFSG